MTKKIAPCGWKSSLVALCVLWSSAASLAQSQTPADAYIYLENLGDPVATQWADGQTSRTLDAVRKMPGFDERYKSNLRVLTQREFNIQYPNTVGEVIYNNFRDTTRPSGVWRSTSLEEYRKQRPSWQTLFSVDAYNREEVSNWVFSNAQVQPVNLPGLGAPGAIGKPQRALLHLSRGGSDAGVFKEFDLATRKLLPAASGGFELPEAKGWATWWSTDELIVSTDFGPQSMTTSGYPREIRIWKRGTPLSSARPLFTAEASDMSADWRLDFAPDGKQNLLMKRRITFNTYANYLWDGATLKPLAVPADATLRLEQGQLTLETRSPMPFEGRTLAAGSLLIFSYAEAAAGQIKPRLLFEPKGRDSVFSVSVTSKFAVVNELRELRSRLVVHSLDGSAPPREVQGLGDWGQTRLWLHSASSNQLWLQHQSYLEPASLHLLDVATLQLDKLHVQGGVTDAAPYQVERGQARSKDGTSIPYTMISRKGTARDGNQPTLLYGYGGFGLSLLPDYQRFALLNWLDQGGTFVMAHIRGGGDFGNAWTMAAKGLKRQTAFDDFIAVAEGLIETKVTRAARLGIYGASNGGLLVSAVLVQRPELFGAVVSRVPLTDLQRYTQLLAGPSWVEEYGNPDKAEDWAIMQTYSPYHNLKPSAKLPPTLYMSNRNDDRVHPAHGRKMAAKQQSLGNPVWFYEPTAGGHSGTATPQMQAEREALLYTFLMGQLMGKHTP
jgi:prolyl oligopeptidase